jgi:hypothetical protein
LGRSRTPPGRDVPLGTAYIATAASWVVP